MEAGRSSPSAGITLDWSAWDITAAIPNAVTREAATNTGTEPTTTTAATMREPTAATTITAINTTATCRDTIILRDFMAGPTIHGARRAPMAGAGADRPGTAPMDITSRRMRRIRARPSGL